MHNNKFILVLLIFISFCCSKQNQSKWHGRIEKVGGVEIFYNPLKGLWDGLENKNIYFIEDLSIGKAKGIEEYVFYSIRDIELDTKKNIYVLDSGDQQIKVYDKKGRFLKIIGQKGQGPGEFSSPIDIYIDKSDLIYICDSDNNRISIFDTQGNFIRSFNLKDEFIRSIVGVNSLGEIIGISFRISSESKLNLTIGTFSVNVYSAQFRFLKNLYYVNIPIMQNYVKEGSRLSLEIPFQNELCCTMDTLGNVYVGDSQEYKIHVFSHQCNLTRQIVKECERSKISKRDIQNYIDESFEDDEKGRKFWSRIIQKQLKLPRYKPVFQKLFFDQNKLWVLRCENDKKDNSFFDIFDDQGRFLKKICFQYNCLSIKKIDKNYIYCINFSGDNIQIKRYLIAEIK